MEMVRKILNNKFVKFIVGLVRLTIWVFVILIILLIGIQRIFNNKVSLGSYRMFTVVTGSMLPEYKVFDVIVSKQVKPSDIKIGDDLVYLGEKESYKDKIITHRVIDIQSKDGKYIFTTKGTANEVADPPVNDNQVYGIVSYRPIILSLLSHILNNSYGFYFLVFVPFTFLVFLEVLDRIKEKEENESR